jgi:hypothetical protein
MTRELNRYRTHATFSTDEYVLHVYFFDFFYVINRAVRTPNIQKFECNSIF